MKIFSRWADFGDGIHTSKLMCVKCGYSPISVNLDNGKIIGCDLMGIADGHCEHDKVMSVVLTKRCPECGRLMKKKSRERSFDK